MKTDDAAESAAGLRLEFRLVSELRALLQGQLIGFEVAPSPSSDICRTLELFVPAMLSRKYGEWTRESLDGLFIARGRVTGSSAIELVGAAILISDQALTPVMIRLEASESWAAIQSLEILLGETGAGPLGISGPDCTSSMAAEFVRSIAERAETIAWKYELAMHRTSS